MKSALFVAPCLSFAGAEKILCWVAMELSRKGYTSHILNLELLNNNAKYTIDGLDNVMVHTLPKAKIPKTNNIHRVFGIAQLAKELHVDVIISFTRYPCVISAIAGIITGIPVITSERGDPYQYSSGVRNRIENILLNRVAGCVFQTEYAMRYYSKSLRSKSVIIPNPVFIDSGINERRESRDTKSFISVGRFENVQKRYDVMIKGFALFSETYKGYKLRLFGKGPDEEYIKALIKSLNLENDVLLMGLTNNSCEEMSKNEVFVITSDYEGIPNALLEAMSIGMPVISTDCSPGGARFLIQNEINGLLIPVGDYKGFAYALSKYASNETLRNACAENAKAVREKFKPAIIADMWEKYIDGVIG